uniref:G1/S-specific cyclin-D2 n=1 Tax=Schistocephalus solidus TaxID=70667 RepID=A0A0V0JAT6_SCHSO
MENDENVCSSHVHSHEKHKDAQNGPITVPLSAVDTYFTANENVIRDLLFDAVRYHSFPAYCVYEPPAHAIWMRRALLNWLREVCEHRNTEVEVLAHTAQLIDRFLQIMPTDKREYQLVGAACFLISSKLKETVPVSVERMVQYTDFSVTRQDLLAKEVTICIALQWNLTGITPLDFIAPSVDFLPCSLELRQLLRRSASHIFMKILHVEGINLYLPGYTAASCILYALQLTVTPDLGESAVGSAARIQRLLGLEACKLREAYQFLLTLFKPGTIELADNVIRVDQCPPPSQGLDQASVELNDLKQRADDTFIDPITPAINGAQLSSSSVCSTTSSSSALSTTRLPSSTGTSGLSVSPLLPENFRTKLLPPQSSSGLSSEKGLQMPV